MRVTSRNRPVSAERLAQARTLFDDGASQREVTRTTGIGRGQLRKYFPSKGWTYVQGGEFRQLTKDSKIELTGRTP
jgi:DNA invertase Pin-like site-specific DNA recombinase